MKIQDNERLIPLAELPTEPWMPRGRNNRPIGKGKVYRLANRGLLRYVSVGSRCRCTTKTWALEAFAAIAKQEQVHRVSV